MFASCWVDGRVQNVEGLHILSSAIKHIVNGAGDVANLAAVCKPPLCFIIAVQHRVAATATEAISQDIGKGQKFSMLYQYTLCLGNNDKPPNGMGHS